uniref:Uncharacterized protein n=1 Tax=Arundo donax TaxID=35708 RepID=A0A0A9F5X4_ARUDO
MREKKFLKTRACRTATCTRRRSGSAR